MNKLEGIKEIILNENMSDSIKVLAIKGILDGKAPSQDQEEIKDPYINIVQAKFNFNSNERMRYNPIQVISITGISKQHLKRTLYKLGIKQIKSGSNRFYELPPIK